VRVMGRAWLPAAIALALALVVAPLALADEPSDEAAYFTKRVSQTEVKVYAKNPVAVGKVQFKVNGRELAWVRATSARDPKLRLARVGDELVPYLVRSVTLTPGQKGAIEIYVDGRRAWRAAYTGR
jgi:hypothetical protein